jgi:hypothetical protein
LQWKALVVWSIPPTEVLSTPVVNFWCASHTLLSQGRAIAHYKNMADRYVTAEGDDFDRCCAEAYMSLAVIHLSRTMGTSPTVGGVRLYNAEPRILNALKITLEESENLLTGHVPSTKFANARLWSLYVGALAEHAEAQGSDDPSRQWFNKNLARQARSMGVFSWQQVRPILLRFLYTDQSKPNGSEWFFKSISLTSDF